MSGFRSQLGDVAQGDLFNRPAAQPRRRRVVGEDTDNREARWLAQYYPPGTVAQYLAVVKACGETGYSAERVAKVAIRCELPPGTLLAAIEQWEASDDT